jgi:hypothetical protein
VSGSRGAAGAVEDFLRRVDRACSDLDPRHRARLMADLAAHASELASQHVDVTRQLGDPEVYAADLRRALGLPAKAEASGRADHPRRTRSLVLAIGLAALVGAASAVSVVGLSRRPAPGPQRLLSGTLSVDRSISVAVPDFTALSVDAAQAAANSAHLYLAVRTEHGPPIRPAGVTFTIGSVVFQSVDAHMHVPEGTQVSLILAGG